MLAHPPNWCVTINLHQQSVDQRSLGCGKTTIGRGGDNEIVLPDPSVSKQHSELELAESGELAFVDLDSRNGSEINGILRRKAILQDNDVVRIGAYTLHFFHGSASLLEQQLKSTPLTASRGETDATIDADLQLPEKSDARALFTLYNVCFWATEGIDEAAYRQRCLRLLLQTFRAVDVQYFSGDGKLTDYVTESNAKPSIKLGKFVTTQFRDCAETVWMRGEDIPQQGQRKIAEFQFLVAPFDAVRGGDPPFLVIVRNRDAVEFSVEDRVLISAVCRLWVRGRGQVEETVRLRSENRALKQANGDALLGDSQAMARLRKQAVKIAGTKVSVLITGETGSGKEVVARFMHENSPRSDKPFVRVNCAAIPDALIESVLFGHVKGAFTGADAAHRGKFIQADGGTLFLDEIGEMPLAVQAKVLRALENSEIEVLGSEETKHVDIRIIAATHRDLKQMVSEGTFREDLFFRLNVVKVRNPPLREHLEDIDILAPMFLKSFCEQSGLPEMVLSSEAMDLLKSQPWPGNVRELRNAIQSASVAAEDLTIEASDVRESLESSEAKPGPLSP